MTQDNTPRPADLASAIQPDDAPHKAADDSEVIYFEGSPLLRADLVKLSVHILISIMLIAAPFLLKKAWTGMPFWVYLVGIAAAACVSGWPILIIRTIHYRISNYRIDYERGLFTKQIDTLELWHVDDLRFKQSLLDRMLNVGNIHVFSRDDTTPNLQLRGIPSPRPVFESLKQRVIAVKRQRGVIKMDGGSFADAGDVGHHGG